MDDVAPTWQRGRPRRPRDGVGVRVHVAMSRDRYIVWLCEESLLFYFISFISASSSNVFLFISFILVYL